MEHAARTLVDVLIQHAQERPNYPAYTVLDNGEEESAAHSFAAVNARATLYARWLVHKGLVGKTVLLLLGDPLQFIEAFLGCLHAGTIAVPLAVPRSDRRLATIRSVAENAMVSAALSTRSDLQKAREVGGMLRNSTEILYLEDVEAVNCELRRPRSEDIAFIQYTSGSTGSPKGVVISHSNLVCNEAALARAMSLSGKSVLVSWLPLFHDMGLIGNVLQALYLGARCVLMPPIAFLQRPLRWLKAIDRYRGTMSGAPNFAYDLCVDRTTDAQRGQLDLSCWRVAFNGSEPVRADTLERFATAFAVAGLRRSSLYPCYGMAESTLIVTGVTPGSEPVIDGPDGDTGEGGSDQVTAAVRKPRRLVSCGTPVAQTEIVIVDPDTRVALPEGTVGEIWVHGTSVSGGYYNSPGENLLTFGAELVPPRGGPYLKTGDLGYLRGGNLFVSGRLKDLIIVRGCNHYPQDLEYTASCSSHALEFGGGAAFTMDQDSSSVVLVHELTRDGWRRGDVSGVTTAIVEAIAAEHQLRVERVVLIKPGSLPRTSSGKVRRALCREMVKAGLLEELSANAAALEGNYCADRRTSAGSGRTS
jgi:acyl-CoA synthetase (AMP-forming)/AMP-acid ligase II